MAGNLRLAFAAPRTLRLNFTMPSSLRLNLDPTGGLRLRLGGNIIDQAVQIDDTVVEGLQLTRTPLTTGEVRIGLRLAGHQRFALVSSTGTVPTLAEFQAGITSTSDRLTVPQQTDRVFLHFADIFAEVAFLGREGQRNSRGLFSGPVALADTLSGVTYYAYSTRYAVRVGSSQVWEIRQ